MKAIGLSFPSSCLSILQQASSTRFMSQGTMAGPPLNRDADVIPSRNFINTSGPGS